jgi:hypothetical protein
MINDDLAGSAQTEALIYMHLRCTGFCVLPGPCRGTGADRVSLAWTSVLLSRVANDNQLTWPYLAFADDWYAAC